MGEEDYRGPRKRSVPVVGKAAAPLGEHRGGRRDALEKRQKFITGEKI